MKYYDEYALYFLLFSFIIVVFIYDVTQIIRFIETSNESDEMPGFSDAIQLFLRIVRWILI